MEKLRWLCAKRPGPHALYELIRVYALANREENQPPKDTLDDKQAKKVGDKPPDYTLYKKPDPEQVSIYLGLPIGPLLRVIKCENEIAQRQLDLGVKDLGHPNLNPKRIDRLYDNYFLVIDREKSKRIDWDKTPYLRVKRPWDYPTDDARKMNPPVAQIERSFIATTAKVFRTKESDVITDCFNHRMSEYNAKGVMDRKGGTAWMRENLEEAHKKPT
ncbi:MAG: hypothetical protein Q9226_008658 [Calogaya cf. arnoldii]